MEGVALAGRRSIVSVESRFRKNATRIAALLVVLASLAVGAGSLAALDAAARTETLTVFVSSTFYTSYNATLNVTASASFRDPDCTSSSQCDRNVEARFVLRQGTSRYGRIATQAYAETGQYSSTLRAKLRVACKLIPQYKSKYYLLTVEAVAPNGEEKDASRTISVRSCQR